MRVHLKLFNNITIYIFIFVLTVILIETYYQAKNPSWHDQDKILGWKLKKNFKNIYIMHDFLGNKYESVFETDENGFRHYKTSSFDNQTILIIGDSFTADPYVSNKDMWFSIMAENLKKKNKKNYSVYATGGGGYGTLQEYLLLKNLLTINNYDYIILQFCSNDFNNNSYNFEKSRFFYTQYLRRPFYDYKNDKIFYDQSLLGQVSRLRFIGESKIFNKIIYYLSIFNLKNRKIESENKYEEEKKIITFKLIKKIREIDSLIKIFVVNCDGSNDGLNKNWIKMFSDNGFIPLPKASNFMYKYIKSNKKDVLFFDGSHYNINGNKLFGIKVAEEINFFLKDDINKK